LRQQGWIDPLLDSAHSDPLASQPSRGWLVTRGPMRAHPTSQGHPGRGGLQLSRLCPQGQPGSLPARVALALGCGRHRLRADPRRRAEVAPGATSRPDPGIGLPRPGPRHRWAPPVRPGARPRRGTHRPAPRRRAHAPAFAA
jgi:hypothetical protein